MSRTTRYIEQLMNVKDTVEKDLYGNRGDRILSINDRIKQTQYDKYTNEQLKKASNLLDYLVANKVTTTDKFYSITSREEYSNLPIGLVYDVFHQSIEKMRD